MRAGMRARIRARMRAGKGAEEVTGDGEWVQWLVSKRAADIARTSGMDVQDTKEKGG